MIQVASGLDRIVHHRVTRAGLKAWRELSGLLLPAWCAVCDAAASERDAMCLTCRQLVAADLLHPFNAAAEAESLPLFSRGPLPVFAAGVYTPQVAQVMLAFKDHGRVNGAGLLRPALSRVLHQVAVEHPQAVLIPIPGSSAGFRRRGYEPLSELLRMPTPLPVFGSVLKHRRRLSTTRAHAGTGRSGRRMRAAEKFTVADVAVDCPVVLVDDVLTTGATLAAAWHRLTEAGLNVVGGAVVTAVQGRG